MKKIASTLMILILACAPADAVTKTAVIKVSVTVAPLFELKVTGPNHGHLEFGEVIKKEGETITIASGDVSISARSNLGRPYHITHALTGPLATDSGKSFKNEDFMSQGAPVTQEPSVIYTSDAKGKSDELKTNYELKVRPDQPSGDYQSRLLYTIVST